MRQVKRSECSVLPLVLKYRWYDMIERGEKQEEYRDISEYWRPRVEKWMRGRCWVVEFRRGHVRNAPRMAFTVHLRAWRSEPKYPEWGEPETRHYVISLDERVELVEDGQRTATLFRVESADGKRGLWRDADGTWNPKFHLLRVGKCKDMPMDDSLLYGKEGKRWFASAPSKELLKVWFSLDDLRDLQSHGFGVYEFEVSEWCKVSEAETIFPRDAIVSRRPIAIGDIYREGAAMERRGEEVKSKTRGAKA